MQSFMARVLTEHTFSPTSPHYSAFSEVLILGKVELGKEVDFEHVFFEQDADILDSLFNLISAQLDDIYPNALGQTVTITTREIVGLTNLPAQVRLTEQLVVLDERLFTFGEKLTFEDFKQRYQIGLFAD